MQELTELEKEIILGLINREVKEFQDLKIRKLQDRVYVEFLQDLGIKIFKQIN